MKIFLIRHGQTVWNEQVRIQGRADIPLNDKGQQQLSTTGQILAGFGEPIDLIITSPLQRARKSAQIVAECVGYDVEKIVVDERLTELSSGMAEGLTGKERDEKYPNGVPGMETVEEVSKRARNALEEYLDTYAGKNLVIIGHVGIIKVIIEVLTKGAIPYSYSNIPIGNGAIVQLEYDHHLESISWYDFEAGCMKPVGWA